MGRGISEQHLLARKRRHRRVRKKISGTAERPRLNVFRSLRHIYAQIIDDIKGNTIVSASTLDKECEVKGDKKERAKYPFDYTQYSSLYDPFRPERGR